MKCKKCGERIEVTFTSYAHVEGDELILDDVNLEDARWYCRNDHKVSAADADVLTKKFSGISAFGRPPGSGSLDKPLACGYKLEPYAPGDGALAFVWVKDGATAGKVVTISDVMTDGRDEHGMQPILIDGLVRMLPRPVRRVGESALEVGGVRYAYEIDKTDTFWQQNMGKSLTVKAADGQEVISSNVLAVMRFFLNKEHQICHEMLTRHKTCPHCLSPGMKTAILDNGLHELSCTGTCGHVEVDRTTKLCLNSFASWAVNFGKRL